MKRLALATCCLIALACAPDSPKSDEAPSATSTAEPAKTAVSVSGTYEFVYPHNTADLIENHYMVLQDSSGTLRGWYYGTSDEFDQVREGYLPGFFVAEMQGLRLDGDSIHFTLTANKEDFFAKPVPLRYRSTSNVPPDQLQKWNGPDVSGSQSYRGVIAGNQITLNAQFGNRVFNRAE